MFKIGIDITKTKKEGNILKIEGIASSPVIDLDWERFSEGAIEKMRESVLKWNIPIRVEHESKFYSDIGVWKEANIDSNGKLYVKWEIDLELSMARDLEVLLRKGVKICMSVGGRVVDAISEFVDKAQNWVTTYTDIELFEISIVKNPANPETSLSIAKSFNIETKEETEVAKSIAESAKEFIKIPCIKEAILAKSVSDVFSAVSDSIKKDWGSETVNGYTEFSDAVYNTDYQLSKTDLRYISMFVEASEAFGATEYTWEEKDTILASMENAMMNGLPDECYVFELLPECLFPHHNADFTINEDWVKYWIWSLIIGTSGSYLTAKEYRLAITHLWQHYVMMNAPYKSEAMEEEEVKKGILEKEMTDTEITAIFKACYEYKVLHKGNRPQVDGNDLSDKEVSKMANAFKTITERVRYTQTVASIAKSFYSLSNNDMTIIEKAKVKEDEAVTEATATVAVEPTEPAAEAVPEIAQVEEIIEVTQEVTPVVHGVETVEKSTIDGAEDVAPVVTEEAGTDASLNNTGSDVTEIETVVEPVPEVASTETAIVEEVVTEVTKSEEPVAVSEPAPESPTESDVLAKAKALVDSAIAEAIAPLVSQLASITKSLETSDTLTKSKDETTQKNNEILIKSIDLITKGYEALNTQVQNMNVSVAFRKSSAVVIEKKDSSGNELSTLSGFNKAVVDEMEVNGGNYALARNSVLSRTTV